MLVTSIFSFSLNISKDSFSRIVKPGILWFKLQIYRYPGQSGRFQSCLLSFCTVSLFMQSFLDLYWVQKATIFLKATLCVKVLPSFRYAHGQVENVMFYHLSHTPMGKLKMSDFTIFLIHPWAS